MDRRRFLQLLPITPAGLVKASPENFEDELRRILNDSPHLARFRPGGNSRDIWLDGVRRDFVMELVASPRPQTPVRGAVYVCINKGGGIAADREEIFIRGDNIAAEWRIEEVVWDIAK